MRMLPLTHDAPLHDTDAARQIERVAAASGPQPALMERAGLGAARLARAVQIADIQRTASAHLKL
jgi:NAD(P)H-hydrate repair Nnr-like enzyme with NAD(P)H-hydrate epimerase domain